MPILFSLLGLSVIAICVYLLYRLGTALYHRRFVEALVADVDDARDARDAKAQRAESANEEV